VKHLHDRAGDVIRNLLDQPGDDHLRGEDDLAFVGRFLAGDDSHETGLACAVASEQTGAFARLDLEIDLVEKRRVAVFQRDLTKLKQRHGGRGIYPTQGELSSKLPFPLATRLCRH
jgi:hypothetical protein